VSVVPSLRARAGELFGRLKRVASPARLGSVQRNPRLLGSAAIGAGLAGLALFGLQSGVPLRLVGTALLVVSLAYLGARYLVPWVKRLSPGYREAFGMGILAAVIVSHYYRLVLGDFPMQGDHPVLALRAKMLADALLQHGTPNAFSDAMFAGQPAHQLYPMGVDLLVCAIRGLSLGLLVVTACYPLAVYSLGTRAGGILAGLVAGLIAVFDRSAYLQAGYAFNVWFGVLAMSLSFSFVLWALVVFDRLLSAPSLRSSLLFTFTLAGALIGHPMSIPLLASALPCQVAARAVLGRLPPFRQWAPSAVAAFLMSGLLSAFWLVPFFARHDWYHPLAISWQPFDLALTGLASGNALPGLAAPFLYAGVFGLILGAARAKPLPAFLLVYAGLAYYFATETALLDFELLKKLPGLGNLQFERFSYPIRAAVLVGAGCFAKVLVDAVVGGLRTSLPPARRLAFALTLAPVAAPYVFYQAAYGRRGPHFIPGPERVHAYASKSKLMPSLRTVADYLSAQPAGRVGRVALVDRWDLHRLVAFAVVSDYPIFKIGFTPENNYRYKFDSVDPEVWRALGITHAIAAVAPSERVRPELERVGRFGDVWLYELKRPNPVPAHVTGGGDVAVVRRSSQSYDVTLSGSTSGSSLVLHVGHYALWTAERNGHALPITRTRIGNTPALFISVPAGDGVTHFRYRLTWIERGSEVLSAASWGLFLCAAWLCRRRRWRAALTLGLGRGVRALGRIEWAVPAFVAAPAVLVIVLLLAPVTLAYGKREVVTELAELLPAARAAEVKNGRAHVCTRKRGGTVLDCPSGDWANVSEVVRAFSDVLRPCIWLHPPRDGARTVVVFDDVELGEYIDGFVGIEDAGALTSQSVLGVAVDDTELGTVPVRRGWHPWSFPTRGRAGTRGRVLIYSRAANNEFQHVCFSAATTR
jgi:hypothetical protein